MRSILQDEKVCFLCGANGASDPLDMHHVFQGINRNASERYGLKVWLCHNKCHEFGKYSVHMNKETNEYLHDYAQKVAMAYYGWTEDEFREHFGKSYLKGEPHA